MYTLEIPHSPLYNLFTARDGVSDGAPEEKRTALAGRPAPQQCKYAMNSF
jgi:hypothetical protein